MRSYLVWDGSNTPLGVVEGLDGVRSYKITLISLPECPENKISGLRKPFLASNGTFLDVTRLLEGIMRSYLVWDGSNTPLGVVEGLDGVRSYKITLISLPGCPEKQDFGPQKAFLSPQGPPEANPKR
jgi:hypothetical protein